MKHLIALLLLPILLYSQQIEPPYFGWHNADSDYEPDAQTYFNAMTTPLSTAQKTKINTLVKMLKDSLSISSLSQAFDVFYVFANETQEAGLQNLVKRAHDATAVNTPTWTQWQGFTGANGKYINTNYNANTQSVVYSLNDCSISIYCRTDVAEATEDFGSSDNTNYTTIRTHSSNNFVYSNINTSTLNYLQPNTDSRGLLTISRNSNSSVRIFKCGAELGGGGTKNSSTIPSYSIFIGCYNASSFASNFSTKEYAIFCSGKNIDSKQRQLSNCIEYYMDSIGTGVIP